MDFKDMISEVVEEKIQEIVVGDVSVIS